VPRNKLLVANLLLARQGFEPSSCCLRFVVVEVMLGRVYFLEFLCCSVCVTSLMLTASVLFWNYSFGSIFVLLVQFMFWLIFIRVCVCVCVCIYIHIYIYIYCMFCILDWLRAWRSGDRIPVEARFFAHVQFSAPLQTGRGAHPASCTMGTGSFPGVECGRGMTLTPHPFLVPRSKNRV
jgi:hypothetical protein